MDREWLAEAEKAIIRVPELEAINEALAARVVELSQVSTVADRFLARALAAESLLRRLLVAWDGTDNVCEVIEAVRAHLEKTA